jgi:hypothetical protein
MEIHAASRGTKVSSRSTINAPLAPAAAQADGVEHTVANT